MRLNLVPLVISLHLFLGCAREQTEEGNLPEYEVEQTEEGALPEYDDVDSADVEVTTDTREIRVPDVDIEPADQTPASRRPYQEEYDELDWGQVAFHDSRTMRQGRQEKITVRISPDPDADVTSDWPSDPSGTQDSAPVVQSMKVSDVMEVELIALTPDAFVIQPAGKQRQAIVGDEVDFSWWVLPTRAGRHKLLLRIYVLLQPPGGNPETRVESKEAEINVEVDRWFGARRFLSSNWQYLAGSPLLLLLIRWLVNRRRNQTRGDEDGPPPDAGG